MRLHFTERRKEIAAGLLVILIIFGGFGTGEAAIRLVHYMKFGFDGTVEESEAFYDEPETGLWLPRPGTIHGGVIVNVLGFRSPSIPVPKPADVIRVAFIGSSTTYDAYAEGERNWPAVLMRELQAQTSCRLDYLNAGVPGFTSHEMRLHFEVHVARAEPDIVVILPSDLNSDSDAYVIERGLHDGVHYRPSWMAQVSELWEHFELNGMVVGRQRAAHSQANKIPVEPHVVSRRFDGRLRKLLDAVEETGATPVLLGINSQLRPELTPEEQTRAAITALLYMPYLSIPQLLALREEYNHVIAEVTSERGIVFIPATALAIPGTAQYYVDTNHYSTAGSMLAGKRLAPLMMAEPGLRRIFQRCQQARTRPDGRDPARRGDAQS